MVRADGPCFAFLCRHTGDEPRISRIKDRGHQRLGVYRRGDHQRLRRRARREPLFCRPLQGSEHDLFRPAVHGHREHHAPAPEQDRHSGGGIRARGVYGHRRGVLAARPQRENARYDRLSHGGEVSGDPLARTDDGARGGGYACGRHQCRTSRRFAGDSRGASRGGGFRACGMDRSPGPCESLAAL